MLFRSHTDLVHMRHQQDVGPVLRRGAYPADQASERRLFTGSTCGRSSRASPAAFPSEPATPCAPASVKTSSDVVICCISQNEKFYLLSENLFEIFWKGGFFTCKKPPLAASRQFTPQNALHRIKHSALCGARQGFCPLTPPPLKRWTKLFNQGQIKERSPSTGVGPAGRGR